MDTDVMELAARELARVAAPFGVNLHATVRDSRYVSVAFRTLRDAETLLAFVVPQDGPDSMYDRATGGCVSATSSFENGVSLSEEDVDRITQTAWLWDIHPDITRRNVDWHVGAAVPTPDVIAMVAALSAASLYGAI